MSQMEPRSLLFVPGSNPERFDKAVAAAADLTCIDLEDAVAPQDKLPARKAALDYLAGCDASVGIRINAVNTRPGLEDVLALLESGSVPAFVMLPKVESRCAVDLLAAWLPPAVGIIPLIETAKGMGSAEEIFAHDRVRAAMFGGVDYAADIGCELSREGLLAARNLLIAAAAASCVTLLDAPYVNVRDLAGLAEEVRFCRRLGMRARSAIHPDQVPVIHSSLMPTEAETAEARRVAEAFMAAGEGVALLDGKLIEAPVYKSALRTLALAGEKI